MARPTVITLTPLRFRCPAGSFGTISVGPFDVRNWPFALIERIAGRFPKNGSISPAVSVAACPFEAVASIHQRSSSLRHAALYWTPASVSRDASVGPCSTVDTPFSEIVVLTCGRIDSSEVLSVSSVPVGVFTLIVGTIEFEACWP